MYKYRIRWQSKITGVEGKGCLILSREAAIETARNANRRIPELRHWVEASKWRRSV